MRKKTVLIVDAGGRGSVLVHTYAKSPWVGKIIAVPGNDLMKSLTKKTVEIHTHLKTTSIEEIIAICKKEKVDLVDVAQDNAVAAGLVDELKKNNFLVLGPTKNAGQIEWDKAWAREFMKKYNLPIPHYKVCFSEEEGLNFLETQPDKKWFIKAYGLLEGKGVLPAESTDEAKQKVKEMKKFGEAGKIFLIEEGLEGEEFSAFAICSGTDFILAGFAQDHKRINNHDEGENTGGMGCVSQPLLITNNVINQVKSIFKITLLGLQEKERPYTGVLYLGGMLVKNKVYIIEFNARWGDPEPQAILPGILNDWYAINESAALGKLSKVKITFDRKVRVAIAASSRGYPIDYSQVKGKEIYGIDEVQKMKNVIFFPANIKKVGKKNTVNGGRLLYVVGEGKNIIDARKTAYAALSHVSIQGNNIHYRTDIGWRDVEKLRSKKIIYGT